MKLELGHQVKLFGLMSAQYNGKYGEIVSLPKSKEGRYGILVDGTDKPVAIAFGNILMEKAQFNKGDPVVLQGLRNERYNGKRGTIVSLPKSEDNRYGVLADGHKRAVAIRSENIIRSAEGQPAQRKSTKQLRTRRGAR